LYTKSQHKLCLSPNTVPLKARTAPSCILSRTIKQRQNNAIL
jgi:hypothetical protein